MSDEKEFTRVGIIGSAGRTTDDRARLSKPGLMDEWVSKVEEYVASQGLTKSKVILVSGGSAYADHVAVMAFLKGGWGGLRLHLPVRFDTTIGKFVGKTSKEARVAYAINVLHTHMLVATGIKVFQQLKEVHTQANATILTYDGFLERDRAIAYESRYMIAFSGNGGGVPHPHSGTAYTWDHVSSDCIKVCYPLPPISSVQGE